MVDFDADEYRFSCLTTYCRSSVDFLPVNGNLNTNLPKLIVLKNIQQKNSTQLD